MASGSSHIPVSQKTGSSVNFSAFDDSASDGHQVDPRFPLWRHVKNLDRIGGHEGGNGRSECRFCGHVIPRSYSIVKTHLLKITNKGVKICTKLTMPIPEELRKEVAVAEAVTTLGTPRSVPLPMELSFSPTSAGLPPS